MLPSVSGKRETELFLLNHSKNVVLERLNTINYGLKQNMLNVNVNLGPIIYWTIKLSSY